MNLSANTALLDGWVDLATTEVWMPQGIPACETKSLTKFFCEKKEWKYTMKASARQAQVLRREMIARWMLVSTGVEIGRFLILCNLLVRVALERHNRSTWKVGASVKQNHACVWKWEGRWHARQQQEASRYMRRGMDRKYKYMQQGWINRNERKYRSSYTIEGQNNETFAYLTVERSCDKREHVLVWSKREVLCNRSFNYDENINAWSWPTQ
jgi:hypothetical protein